MTNIRVGGKSMDKEKNIPFYNDLLFKYFVYNNEDQECMYLLKTIIEAVTPLRCKELYVKIQNYFLVIIVKKSSFGCKSKNK